MKAIWMLARQVVHDAMDEWVFLTAGLYGGAVLFLAPMFSGMALGAGTRAVADLGWLLMWVVACWVACWLGIRAIGLDLHHRTAALVLSRPISVAAWATGRIIGIGLALGIQMAFMMVFWLGIAAIWGVPIGVDWVLAGILLWAEALMIASIAGLLSTLVAPVFAAACTAGLWIAGHLAQEYTQMVADAEMVWASSVLFTVVPDLDRFNVQHALVHGVAIPPSAALASLAYAIVWIAVLQGLTVLVVSRRDLA